MAALAHFAINADNVDRARQFYEKVFGWKFNAWGPPGFYQIKTGGSDDVGGALQERRELIPGQKMTGFECTISVKNLDVVEKAVLKAGGKTVLQRSVIVGVGTLMFFQDTEGNVLGAMQYDANAE